MGHDQDAHELAKRGLARLSTDLSAHPRCHRGGAAGSRGPCPVGAQHGERGRRCPRNRRGGLSAAGGRRLSRQAWRRRKHRFAGARRRRRAGGRGPGEWPAPNFFPEETFRRTSATGTTAIPDGGAGARCFPESAMDAHRCAPGSEPRPVRLALSRPARAPAVAGEHCALSGDRAGYCVLSRPDRHHGRLQGRARAGGDGPAKRQATPSGWKTLATRSPAGSWRRWEPASRASPSTRKGFVLLSARRRRPKRDLPSSPRRISSRPARRCLCPGAWRCSPGRSAAMLGSSRTTTTASSTTRAGRCRR